MIAIENVRLFEEVQARTAELENRWNSRPPPADVLKVDQPLAAFDLQPVLETMVETATRLCER